jgi:peptidoglycan LD-endopeptidase LytH
MRRMLWVLVSFSWSMAQPIGEWQRFEKQVRDQTLPKDSLQAAFPNVWSGLRLGEPSSGERDTIKQPRNAKSPSTSAAWIFPLPGYSFSSVGKGGFRPDIRYGGSPVKGYDFFDGNRHGGHPAYDIFIHDANQDSRDDRTDNPVNVVAPVNVVVLSRETQWKPGSPLRGGKYLWAKEIGQDRLLYFSHLDSVFAQPGDTLSAGKNLGTVGRTGKNAWAKRSPTHLHMMVLAVSDGRLNPVDFIAYLEP